MMYQGFAAIYDALMKDVDYRAWADYYRKLSESCGVKVRRAADCACGTGALEVVEMQAPNAKRMNAKAYLMGKNIPVGTIFSRERNDA